MGLDLSHSKPCLKNNDTFKDYPDFIQRHRHLITQDEIDDNVYTEAIYVLEIGYQRKGMNKNFHIDFQNEK